MTAWVLSLILQMALSGIEVNPGQLGDDIFWIRWSTACWYVDLSKRKDGPKPTIWMSTYDFLFLTDQYHIVKGNVKSVDAKGLCAAPANTETSQLYPSAIIAPVPPPSVITAPTGALTSTEGVWTFGPVIATGGNAILLNGVATGGFGAKLQLSKGKVFTQNTAGAWFQWAGAWIASAAP